MVELVQELEKLDPSNAINEMIAEAKAGEYHDYKNQKYACGKVAVVGKLRAAGLLDLAARVIDGEFDEEADAEDRKHLYKTAIEGGFTPAQAQKLFGLTDEDMR